MYWWSYSFWSKWKYYL